MSLSRRGHWMLNVGSMRACIKPGSRFRVNITSGYMCACICFTLNRQIPRMAFWLMECAKAERICQAVNYHLRLPTLSNPFISYPTGQACYLAERRISRQQFGELVLLTLFFLRSLLRAYNQECTN